MNILWEDLTNFMAKTTILLPTTYHMPGNSTTLTFKHFLKLVHIQTMWWFSLYLTQTQMIMITKTWHCLHKLGTATNSNTMCSSFCLNMCRSYSTCLRGLRKTKDSCHTLEVTHRYWTHSTLRNNTTHQQSTNNIRNTHQLMRRSAGWLWAYRRAGGVLGSS